MQDLDHPSSVLCPWSLWSLVFLLGLQSWVLGPLSGLVPQSWVHCLRSSVLGLWSLGLQSWVLGPWVHCQAWVHHPRSKVLSPLSLVLCPWSKILSSWSSWVDNPPYNACKTRIWQVSILYLDPDIECKSVTQNDKRMLYLTFSIGGRFCSQFLQIQLKISYDCPGHLVWIKFVF